MDGGGRSGEQFLRKGEASRKKKDKVGDEKEGAREGKRRRLQEIPNTCCSTAESSAELHNKNPECSECVLTSVCVCGWQ